MKRLMLIMVLFCGLDSAIANADWKGSVDTAESALRILLNEPANGETFFAQNIKESDKIKVLTVLMNLEMRHPGLLRGQLDPGFEWEQYKTVVRLFQRFELENGFWYSDKSE